MATMWDKVTFVQQLGLLNKATSDDEMPTPGYMYKDICLLTYKSTSYCTELIDFLLDRLQDNSYHVKLKVLRLIRVAVEKGHPEFKESLRRRSRDIQGATGFGGPPDPLHGNVPYVMIRNTAKTVCQLLFETESMEQVAAPVTPVTGMGSSTMSGSKMQGFGNTQLKDKGLGESIMSGIKEMADKMLEPERPHPSYSALSDQQFGHYSPIEMDTRDVEVPQDTHTSSNINSRRHVPEHRVGVAGGGWDDPVPDADHPRSTTSQHSSGSSDRNDSVASEDYTAEQQLVSSIVMQKATPIPERTTLKQFITRCGSLNCDRIMEMINEQMQSAADTNSLMRCLILVEQLLRGDVCSVEQLAATCHPGLASLHGHKHTPVHHKARKIILQLQKLLPHTDYFQGITSKQVQINGIKVQQDLNNVQYTENNKAVGLTSTEPVSISTSHITGDLNQSDEVGLPTTSVESEDRGSNFSGDSSGTNESSHLNTTDSQATGAKEGVDSELTPMNIASLTLLDQREGSHDSLSSVDSLERS